MVNGNPLIYLGIDGEKSLQAKDSDEILENYFVKLAAAFVRGQLIDNQTPYSLSSHLLEIPLDDLEVKELAEIIQFGLAIGLKLNKFKKTMGLARVQRVLGVLHSLNPNTLLDIGSGRGTFLWPLLDSLPNLKVTSIDKEEIRVRDINAVKKGGITNISAKQLDVKEIDFEDKSFDVVTMLEVLEHIPNAQQALNEAVRVAKNFLVLSVPSKEDNNPEHIHLFNKNSLGNMLKIAGASSSRFDYVLNHLIVVAKMQKMQV
jgi:ubiquinone/menaquinone biosynthesis C-methylase UbiE